MGCRGPLPWPPRGGSSGPGLRVFGLPGAPKRSSVAPRGASEKGQKVPFFRPLRRKVQGEWGGSAHSPDPTAQSARSAETRRAIRRPHRRQARRGVREGGSRAREGRLCQGPPAPGPEERCAARETPESSSLQEGPSAGAKRFTSGCASSTCGGRSRVPGPPFAPGLPVPETQSGVASPLSRCRARRDDARVSRAPGSQDGHPSRG